jgi:uncharacterized Zn finger protein (UPF0148 family)
VTNRNGFCAYKNGYVRCTSCGKWLRREDVIEVDAQGSLLCPVCHRRVRLNRRKVLKEEYS